MPHVVTGACVNCKHCSCAEACPVSCFFKSSNMSVIDPDACIDCGVCAGECPVGAVVPDTTEEGQKWLALKQMNT